MVNDPHCFELIKSLDKAEKIYFKRHLTSHTEKNKPTIYLQLFDELDKMQLYDVKKLHKKFEGEKFLDHLSVSFNYLYNMLLSTLLQFYEEKDDQLKATEMLGQIKVLLTKRLFKQAEAQIKRAKKFMKERELFAHLFLLGAHEFNLVSLTLQKNELKNLQNINQNRKKSLRKLKNQLEVIELSSQLFQLVRAKELNPNIEFNKATLVNFANKLQYLEKSKNEAGYFFKLRFLLAKQRYLFINNELQSAFNILEEILAASRNSSKKNTISSNTYLTILKNYLSTAIDLWQPLAIKIWLPKFDEIVKKEPKLKLECITQTLRFQFWQYLMEGDFISLKSLIKSYLNFLIEDNSVEIEYYKFYLFTNLSVYNFLVEDMLTCLTWVNKIFELKNVDDSIRKNNLSIRCIEIMAHFNLKNFELIDSLCLSTLRQQQNIASQASEFDEVKKWLQIMRKAIQVHLPKDEKKFVNNLPEMDMTGLPIKINSLLINCWEKSILEDKSLEQVWINMFK